MSEKQDFAWWFANSNANATKEVTDAAWAAWSARAARTEVAATGDEAETIEANPKSWIAWKREAERLQARLNWAANELLACDYGDNPEKRGIGWSVFGWRDVNGIHSIIPYEKVRRIYGKTINEAIDEALAVAADNRRHFAASQPQEKK